MILKPLVSDRDHIQGKPNALIELVEYGDYQSPACGEVFPIIKSIQQKFGDDLKFVFRHFPISKIHHHATLAAVASEAADRQGRFWGMHDMLLVNQNELHRSALVAYAEMLDLDDEQFQFDLEDSQLFDKVQADFESGIRSGVYKTPSLFLNGTQYDGKWDEFSLSLLITRMIELILG